MLPTVLFWNASVAAAMAIAVFLVQRVGWLKCRPTLRHALWLLVFFKLVTPPLVTVPVAILPGHDGQSDTNPNGLVLPGESEALDGHSLHAAPAPAPALSAAPMNGQVIGRIAVGASLLGTIGLLLLILWRARKVGRLVRQADVGSGTLHEAIVRSSRTLNLKRPPSLRIVSGCVTPFLWVTVREAFLVVPRDLAARLDPESMDLVIRHELSHYVRRDHWTNYFVSVVCALCWWNPVAWWARRELRLVQELCCDAMVLAADRSQARRYAETLLQTVDFVASGNADTPVAATALGSSATFHRRIEMISQSELPYRVPLLARAAVVILGILLVAGSPTFAQHDDEEAVQQARRLKAELREVEEILGDLSARLTQLLHRSERDEPAARDQDDENVSERSHRYKLQLRRNHDHTVDRDLDFRERYEDDEDSREQSAPEARRRSGGNRFRALGIAVERQHAEAQESLEKAEERMRDAEATLPIELERRVSVRRLEELYEDDERRERAGQETKRVLRDRERGERGELRDEDGRHERAEREMIEVIRKEQGRKEIFEKRRRVEAEAAAGGGEASDPVNRKIDRELEELRAGRYQWLRKINELQEAREHDQKTIDELQHAVKELRKELDARSEGASN